MLIVNAILLQHERLARDQASNLTHWVESKTLVAVARIFEVLGFGYHYIVSMEINTRFTKCVILTLLNFHLKPIKRRSIFSVTSCTVFFFFINFSKGNMY